MHLRSFAVLAALAALISGCTPSKPPVAPGPTTPGSRSQALSALLRETGFVDVTQAAGIDFKHSIGHDGQPGNLIESTGSGVAFIDYDGDGLLDIYLLSGVYKPPFSQMGPPRERPRCRLYHNLGNGTFEDVTDKAGVALEDRYAMAVGVADYDNDGRPDIYVACYHGPNVLFHNNGDGTFTDVAKKAGVDAMACSDGVAWFDYDNDGYLDLYVCNYIKFDPTYKYFYNPDGFPGPLSYEGECDILYRNRGDGTFENVTAKVGGLNPGGRAMGVVAADYDDRGSMDVYVANDAMEKDLYRNEGGKRFVNVATQAGVALNVAGEGTASMMATWGDYDNDGRLDLFVPDNSFKSLFRNLGNGMFQDESASANIAALTGQYVTWGSGFIDYDNDSNLDLFMVNGALHHLYGQESVLLRNDGKGHFEDVSDRSGEFLASKRKICGRGAAFGDYDNDGKVDVVIVTLNDRAVLLHNQTRTEGHWLTLSFVGTKSNRDGIGVKVKLLFDGKTRVAQKEGGGAYLSSNDPRLHFGLGKSTTVQRIEVTWPSGTKQTLSDVAADQILVVREPKG